METGLRGKVALVCAASRGLGRATAMALAAEGARVAICARHMPTLEATAGDIQAATGAEVLAIAADVSRQSDVTRLVAQAADHFGGLDILVTNSGGPKAGLFTALTEADWRTAIDQILMSIVTLVAEAMPAPAPPGRRAHHQHHVDLGSSAGGRVDSFECVAPGGHRAGEEPRQRTGP